MVACSFRTGLAVGAWADASEGARTGQNGTAAAQTAQRSPLREPRLFVTPGAYRTAAREAPALESSRNCTTMRVTRKSTLVRNAACVPAGAGQKYLETPTLRMTQVIPTTHARVRAPGPAVPQTSSVPSTISTSSGKFRC